MVVLVLQRVGGKGIKGVVFDQVDPGFINKGVGFCFGPEKKKTKSGPEVDLGLGLDFYNY